MSKKKKYWIAAREYAGLAEAGGVKSVVTSLARGFQHIGWDVTVLMPLYGCTAISDVEDFDVIENASAEISVGEKIYRVVYAQGFYKNIKVVFIVHSIFTSKMGVYTYTRLEEALNPTLKSGEGHFDANILSVLFQKAVVQYGMNTHTAPEAFHCHDAHTALIPFLSQCSDDAKKLYNLTKFVITIHNAGYFYRDQCKSITQASELIKLPAKNFSAYALNGKPEPFLLSQSHATFTTVSPWYAEELLDPNNEFCSDISTEFVKRDFNIIGITNGIDYEDYNPTKTAESKLPFAFNPIISDLQGKYDCRNHFLQTYNVVHTCNEEKKIDRVFQYGILNNEILLEDQEEQPIYFSFHGRLVHQKGIDVLTEASRIVLKKRKNARFIVMGQGSKELEQANCDLAKDFYGKYLFFQGYDQSLSRLCIAMSDFLVLPSFFEPCGLLDFIGQFFGTIPVAHAAGGLNKIIHEKTGFLYTKNEPEVLANLLISLIDKKIKEPKYFSDMISYSAKYIKDEYSWDKVICEKYLPQFL